MENISHDQLFKQLLGEFFPEFIDLFFPQVSAYLDRQSLEFLPLALFAEPTAGKTFETDLVVKARFRNQESCFIVHVEHQGRFTADFDRRMFNYFSLLHRDYGLPVYPIVLFSHRSPRSPGDRAYRVEFPDWEVLRFNYRVIRLNHLKWQEFVGQPNPVASALMAKMKIQRQERPDAKLACLRMLAQLSLNPVQTMMLSGFIDTYLRLGAAENQILMEQLDRIEPREKEGVMQIVTSWMEQGLEQGLEQARSELLAIALDLLPDRIGPLAPALEQAVVRLSRERLGQLIKALMRFTSPADLQAWLDSVPE
jgi:Domain of unknown function (DUF4351)